ncbi:MAG: RNA methyltransferase [Melioribacteraceae bacterium]|nr:RNA methyltransferase [Melioribacteraceae bacterium]
MRNFLTERRLSRIEKTIRQRQHSLAVAIENVHDPHNVSAIFRTCDAVGVPKVDLIYTIEKFPKIHKVTSASAFKWVEKENHSSVKSCFDKYQKLGYKIYSSLLDENSVSLYDLDFTQKTLIVLGNEHRGVSDDAVKYADETFYIPMRGMVESLNVSVAAAVTLYEAQRQRLQKGMYDKSELTEEELESWIDKWAEK